MLKLFVTGWRLLLTPLAILAIIAFCGLGVWQINRLQQRLALNEKINTQMAAPPIALDPARVDPNALEYRVVSVRGTFDPTQEVFLRNRSYNGATGYHVLTPLRLRGTDKAVLVDRGWIPLPVAEGREQADYAPPRGEVTVRGVARVSQEYTVGPQDPPFSDARPRLDAWFQVNIPRIEQQVGYQMLPIFVAEQPSSDAPQSLPIPAATEDLGPGSNLSYAIQWFSFALITLIGYPILIYHNVYKPKTVFPARAIESAPVHS